MAYLPQAVRSSRNPFDRIDGLEVNLIQKTTHRSPLSLGSSLKIENWFFADVIGHDKQP